MMNRVFVVARGFGPRFLETRLWDPSSFDICLFVVFLRSAEVHLYYFLNRFWYLSVRDFRKGILRFLILERWTNEIKVSQESIVVRNKN